MCLEEGASETWTSSAGQQLPRVGLVIMGCVRHVDATYGRVAGPSRLQVPRTTRCDVAGVRLWTAELNERNTNSGEPFNWLGGRCFTTYWRLVYTARRSSTPIYATKRDSRNKQRKHHCTTQIYFCCFVVWLSAQQYTVVVLQSVPDLEEIRSCLTRSCSFSRSSLKLRCGDISANNRFSPLRNSHFTRKYDVCSSKKHLHTH